jgi:hypothetical protein
VRLDTKNPWRLLALLGVCWRLTEEGIPFEVGARGRTFPRSKQIFAVGKKCLQTL